MIFVLAFSGAVSSVLYYGALNLMFGFMENNPNASKFETGQNVGRICFAVASATLLGTITESLIFLLVASTIMYLVSIVFLCIKYKDLTSEIKKVKFNKVTDVLKSSKWFNIYHISSGIMDTLVYSVIPVYLYYSGLSFTGAGLLVSLNEVFKIFANYISFVARKYNKEKLFVIIASALLAVEICSMLFVFNVYALFVIILFMAFSVQFIFVTLFTEYVKQQKALGYYQDAVFCRDVILNSSRSLFCATYFILFSFPLLFIIGTVSTASVIFTGTKALKMEKMQ